MPVQAYVLIQTEVGKAAAVAAAISELDGVAQAEDVTGPYDVIVRAEASDGGGTSTGPAAGPEPVQPAVPTTPASSRTARSARLRGAPRGTSACG